MLSEPTVHGQMMLDLSMETQLAMEDWIFSTMEDGEVFAPTTTSKFPKTSQTMIM